MLGSLVSSIFGGSSTPKASEMEKFQRRAGKKGMEAYEERFAANEGVLGEIAERDRSPRFSAQARAAQVKGATPASLKAALDYGQAVTSGRALTDASIEGRGMGQTLRNERLGAVGDMAVNAGASATSNMTRLTAIQNKANESKDSMRNALVGGLTNAATTAGTLYAMNSLGGAAGSANTARAGGASTAGLGKVGQRTFGGNPRLPTLLQ